MSDTASPYEVGSPNWLEEQKGLLSSDVMTLPGLARGTLSGILVPPPGSDVHGIAAYTPGALTGLYNTAEGIRRLMDSKFPVLQHLDDRFGIGQGLPGAGEAKKAVDASIARSFDWIPSVANNEADKQYESAMGDVGATLGVPLAGMPKVAKAITATLIPGSTAPMLGPVVSGVGNLGIENLAKASQPNATPPAGQQPNDKQAVGAVPPGAPLPTQPPELPPPEPHTPESDDVPWLTYGGIAVGTLAGAATLAFGRRFGASMETFVRGAPALREMAANEKFNIQVHSREAGGGFDVPIDAKPTVPGQSVVTRFLGNVMDKDYPAKQYVYAIAPDTTSGAIERAKYGESVSESSFHSRVQNFAESGYDPNTGLRLPSFQRHLDKIVALTPDDQKLYNRTRYALNEIDNRQRNFDALMKKGGTVDEEATRVMFPDVTTEELRNWVKAGRSRSDVNDLVDEANAIHRGLIHIGEIQGYFSAADSANLVHTHPNYAPTVDVNGRILNPFEKRDITNNSGGGDIVIPIWEADKQHLTTVMRTYENNARQARVLQQGVDYQDRNSVTGMGGLTLGPAQLIKERTGSSGGPLDNTTGVSDRSSITVKINGVPRTFEIRHPLLHAAISGEQKQLGALMNWLSDQRVRAQSHTTGVGSMIGGVAFPIKNAIRDMVIAPSTRPQGTSYGFLDALANKATGGRVGFRMDPTGGVGQVYAIAADWAAKYAQMYTRALAPEADTVINRFVRGTFGDVVADNLRKGLEKQYYNSVLYDMKQRGIMHTSGFGTEDMTVQQVGSAPVKQSRLPNATGTSSPLNNTSIDLFRSHDPTIPFTDVPIPIGGKLVPFLKFNEFIHEMFNIINDSAKSHFLRLNSGKFPGLSGLKSKLPDEVLTQATRELTADMSRRGGGALTRHLGAAVPYYNPIVQGTANIVSAFVKHPFATIGTIISMMGTVAIGQVFSAMLAGPEHVDHMLNQTSDAEKARLATFYHGDTPPEGATTISWPQELQPLYPLLLQAAVDLAGVGSHFISEAARNSTLTAFTEFMGKHVTYSTLNAMRKGLSAQFSISAPPTANVVAGLAGKSVTLSPDQLTEPNGRSFGDRIVVNAGGGTPQAPNVSPTTALGYGATAGEVAGKVMEQWLKAFYGVTGDTLWNMYSDFAHTRKAGGSVEDGLHNAVDSWKLKAADNNSWGTGILWQNTSKDAQNTHLVEMTNNKLAALNVTKGAVADLTQEGLTRRGGVPLDLPASTPSKLPEDPLMKEVWFRMDQANARIRKDILPYAQDIKKQIDALPESGKSPYAIRQQRNVLMGQYQERMGDVHDALKDVEDNLSELVAGHVHLEHIDWTKGPDQFVR